MHGDMVYFELGIDAVEETLRFYRTLFDWRITESHLNDTRYFLIETPGKKIGGGFDAKLKPKAATVMLYIACDDIEKILSQIATFKGAAIIKGKTLISDAYGKYAIIKDPSGNLVGLQED